MKQDRHVLFFFLNAIFVIIGYGVNTYTQQAFLGPMKVLRIGLVGLAMIMLLVTYIRQPRIFSSFRQSYAVLALVVFMGVFYAYDLNFAFGRVITFIFPFLYLSIFFAYLHRKYKIEQIGYFVNSTFQWTYLLPVLVLVFLERGALGSTDISRSVGIGVGSKASAR